jgi:hypothetical protein
MDRCARIASDACSEMHRLDQTPFLRLPKVADQARGTRRSLQQSAASASNAFIADPPALVDRALAILAQEDQVWQARRGASLPSKRTR